MTDIDIKGKDIIIEDKEGAVKMSFRVDNNGFITKLNDCELTDMDYDWIKFTEK